MSLILGLERAAERLEHGDQAAQVRARSLRENRGPLDLALTLNPQLRRTPATEFVSDALEWAITTPRARLVLSMPPQETKTTLVRHAAIRKLQHHPERRNAIASYAVDLARTSGRFTRSMIEAYGSHVVDPATGFELPDHLGLQVRADHAAAGDWSLQGHDGALYAIGVGGGLTGRPVDGTLFIDDPVKDREQADSQVYRDKVAEWRSAVAETRLGPEASLVLVMTRWHEDDLAGRMIAEDLALDVAEQELWVINIPALNDGETEDAVADLPGARTPEGYLISARNRTPAQWRAIERRVGPRTWSALYQGRPSPLEGGIFLRAWFDDHRVHEAPPMREVVLGVDPADTGTGDAAGILVAGVGLDGHLYFLADLSGQLSQSEWARKVCLAWVRYKAVRVIQEHNLGMRTSIADAWSILRRQAVALEAFSTVEKASAELADRGDTVAADPDGLREVARWAQRIVEIGPNGPRVVSVPAKVSKQQRAESSTQPFQDGRAHIVGRLPALEHECVTWQVGQASPNRIDTLSMLVQQLSRSGGRVLV